MSLVNTILIELCKQIKLHDSQIATNCHSVNGAISELLFFFLPSLSLAHYEYFLLDGRHGELDRLVTGNNLH